MNYSKYFLSFLILIIGCQNRPNEEELNSSQKLEKIDLNKVDKLKTQNDDIDDEPIDTIINSDKYLVIANRNSQINIIKISDSLKYRDFKIVDFKDDMLVVAKNLKEETFEIYEKYNPKSTFTDYKVKVFHGKLVEPDFNNYPWAKRYITTITNECKNGINFAGKYTLVIWGCGSPCQAGAIVDRTNGKIYDGYFSAYDSEFKKDSKLIITNSALIDKKTKLINLHNLVEVSTEIWNGSAFIKL